MTDNNRKVCRREFLKRSCRTLCMMALGSQVLNSCKDNFLFSSSEEEYYIKPARHWKSLTSGMVQCRLCPNECTLGKGDRGICRTRQNIDGKLHTMVYSRMAAVHVDPVEKKPLFHFLPGARAFSVATAGCNLSCKFCQNWQISQSTPEELSAVKIPPDDISIRAKGQGAEIIAYTYNEPTMQFEYIMEASSTARKRGVKSVIISNGHMQDKPASDLAGVLDGVKIDLKSFSDKFYQEVCGGRLQRVLKNLQTIHSSGKWLEIVNLVIPTMNDSPKEIREMAKWVKNNLSPDVPIHFTRFHSMYLIRNLPPTPVKTLEMCRSIAMSEGIRYAYIGNVPGHKWENTYCHGCNRMVIKRSGFFNIKNLLKEGKCPYCGTKVPGVWV